MTPQWFASLANPHATIEYLPPNPEKSNGAIVFARVTEELPPETAEIKPHPYGVELGVLMQMFRDTHARNLRSCLQNDFSRVSGKVADEICERAHVKESRRPSEVTREEAERIHHAIQATKIMAPPTDCIAPIGEELIERALRAEVKADFYTAVRYPEFPVQVKAYLATLGPQSPKALQEMIDRVATMPSMGPDGAGANPSRWSLFTSARSARSISSSPIGAMQLVGGALIFVCCIAPWMRSASSRVIRPELDWGPALC